MKFYHGTTKEKWKKIQEEGVLWGIRNAPSRCTYLAVREEDAYKSEVLLEVEYTPNPGKDDNYVDGAWQLRVYVPISIKKIKIGE